MNFKTLIFLQKNVDKIRIEEYIKVRQILYGIDI